MQNWPEKYLLNFTPESFKVQKHDGAANDGPDPSGGSGT